MIVQLTLEGHPVKIKAQQTITPGFYLMLVKEDDSTKLTPLDVPQAQRVIRDILGAE